MTTETHVNGDTLTVRRVYDASLAETWDAWIEAGKTTHWWGCSQTTKVRSEVEPKLGGKYHHEMTIEGHGEHLIAGEFTAYDPPSLLAYRMPGIDPEQTMDVRVEFKEVSGGTEVTLTQNMIPEPFRGMVEAGWTASFDRLARFFDGERRAA